MDVGCSLFIVSFVLALGTLPGDETFYCRR